MTALFHDIPWYSTIFYICCDLPRQTMAPRYSMPFPEIARYSMIFQCAQWASKTYHDQDIPRYLVSCWHGRSLSSFCGKGGSGADAPCRRYRNIPNVVLERPRGVLGLSAMHDITTINMPFHDVPKYSMIYSIFSELPRQTMTSWCSALFHDIPRVVWWGSLFLIFVARAARLPMPPSGDTEISPN